VGLSLILASLGIPPSHHPGYTSLSPPWVYLCWSHPGYTTVGPTLGTPLSSRTHLGTPLLPYTPGYTTVVHTWVYTVVHTLGIPLLYTPGYTSPKLHTRVIPLLSFIPGLYLSGPLYTTRIYLSRPLYTTRVYLRVLIRRAMGPGEGETESEG